MTLVTPPLPAEFLKTLSGHEEVLVSSREDGRERSVRAWYVIGPEGDLYLFTYSYALRVQRWRRDPWVRLRVPGTTNSIEGTVRFVDPSELSGAVSDLVMERWWMWGATTPQGLRRMLADESHVLLRVENTRAAGKRA